MDQERLSLTFKNEPMIYATAAVGGKEEYCGPLGNMLDDYDEDDKFGGNSWEEAESQMIEETLGILFEKGKISHEKVETVIGGDLRGQILATAFGVKKYEIPFTGIFGACSTMGEALLIAAVLIDGGYAKNAAAVSSSHFAGAEREFRFPLSYGNQKPPSSSVTVTGCGAVLVMPHECAEKSNAVKIVRATLGTIVDFGITDKNNMGAAMAPACAETIKRHLRNFDMKPENFDAIITGDLGKTGSRILMEMLSAEKLDISEKHIDCGMVIYDRTNQKYNEGGSGCGCSAVTFCTFVMEKMRNRVWRHVLFVPTGALLSTVSTNEGNTVPGIAHAIELVS